MRRRLSVLEPSCGRAELSDAVVSQQLSSRDCPLIWGCSLCASLTRRHAWAIARESRAENKSGYWLSAVRPPKRKRSARRRHRPLCTVHSLIFRSWPVGTEPGEGFGLTRSAPGTLRSLRAGTSHPLSPSEPASGVALGANDSGSKVSTFQRVDSATTASAPSEKPPRHPVA